MSATLQYHGNSNSVVGHQTAPPLSYSGSSLTQSQHSHGVHENGATMGQGPPFWSMMPSAGESINPHFTYSSAPYQASVPATQPFAPQQAPSSHSAPPQQPLSPNAGSQSPSQPNQSTSSVKYPMAAPPLPHTPANAQQQAAAPSPTSPQSPGLHIGDQQRIDLLFDINIELLQEVNKLQAEGKGGAISPQQVMQLQKEGKPANMASDEYIQCLRRVQANLAYLMPKAQPEQTNQAKAPAGPAHMTAPPHMAQLSEKYERLRELFPNWQGLDQRIAASSSSPVAHTANGMMQS